MCGMFFAIGDLLLQDDKFVDNMFIMDSLRGEDSCGLVTVPAANTTVHTFKRAVSPHDFINMKQYDDLMGTRNEAILGHNRKATKGKINTVNAHPFICGNIVGMHNGTLTNQSLLPDYKDYEVDSENIMHSIDKIGIEETWKKVAGAAALIWYDMKDATVNVIRNSQRPFFLVTSKDGKSVYGASEQWMLKAALSRNSIPHNKIKELPINTLTTYTINSAIGSKEVVSTTVKKLKARATVVAIRGATGGTTGKSGGTIVDFKVIYKDISNGRYPIYTVIDNADKTKRYLLEDYGKKLQLEINDFATAKTMVSFSTGLPRLDPWTVALDSQWEWVIDLDEEEEDNTTVPLKECSWCSSPIQEDEKYLTINEYTSKETVHVCECCAYDPQVKQFLEYEDVQTAGAMI